jgi:transposase
MQLDLETFLTALYVMVDDLYQSNIRPHLPNTGGPAPRLSDSEVLCLGLAAQWRSGVPWQSERGLVRYVRKHLAHLFPQMISQSAFNRRLRRLWGAFLLIQEGVAEALGEGEGWEVMDCAPVPIARGARSFHPGWLEDIARIGKGGNDRYFYGAHLLLVVNAQGMATGWTLAAGNIQDRWLAEVVLSSRAGQPQCTGPRDAEGPLAPDPPRDWMGPAQSGGRHHGYPILADLGYSGAAWQQHWREDYGAQVLTPPVPERHAARVWFSGLRQKIETAFAALCGSFGLHFPGAHTTWGLITRIGAKIAAYNTGILLNRQQGRPDLAFGTLIC